LDRLVVNCTPDVSIEPLGRIERRDEEHELVKRRSLDVVFSVGGLLLAGLLPVLGLVLENQADFAKSYVTDQLSQQLLTSYGFSIFGQRAHQAALVPFAAALVLLLASIAGFIHAFTTSKDQTV
jgi:hypothetical protein